MYSYIYKLTNTINKKIYVGKTKNIKRRLKEYRITKITKPSQKYEIMFEIIKYGRDNFIMEVIEKVSDELANDREIYWIDKLNSRNSSIGYNKKTGGVGGKLTPDSIAKMSRTTSQFKHSVETKIKKSIPIIVYVDGIYMNFSSAKIFSDMLKCDKSIITAYIKKGKPYKNHFIFYKDAELRNLIESDNPHYLKIRDSINKGVETIEPELYIYIP